MTNKGNTKLLQKQDRRGYLYLYLRLFLMYFFFIVLESVLFRISFFLSYYHVDSVHIGIISGMTKFFVPIFAFLSLGYHLNGKRKSVFLVSGLLLWLGYMVIYWKNQTFSSDSLVSLYVGRVISALGVGGISTYLHLYMIEIVPNEKRAQFSNFYGIAGLVGASVGPMVIPFLFPNEASIDFMLISIFCTSIYLLIAITLPREGKVFEEASLHTQESSLLPHKRKLSILSVYRSISQYEDKRWFVYMLIFGSTFGGVFSFFGAMSFAYPEVSFSSFFLYFTLSMLGQRLVFMSFIHRISLQVLLSLGFFLLFLQGILPILFLSTHQLGLLGGWMGGLYGIAHGILYTTLSTWITLSQKNTKSLGAILFIFILASSYFIMSVFSGLLLRYMTHPIFYCFLALWSLLVLLHILIRGKRHQYHKIFLRV